MPIKHLILISIIILFKLHLNAQEIDNKSALKLSEIMKGNAFIGHQPGQIRWCRDSKTILFNWNPSNTLGSIEYGYQLNDKVPFVITPEFYTTNTDRFLNEKYYSETEFYAKDGALYSYNIFSKSAALILKPHGRIRNVMRVKDRSLVYFQINNDIYQYDARKGSTAIVLRFEKKSELSDAVPTYLEQEELELFQFHQQNAMKEEWNNSQNKIWKSETPTIYCKDYTVSNIQITPNMKFFTFRYDDYPKSKKTHVEHHIARDGHTFITNARRKVSDEDPTHKLGVYSVEKNSI